MFKKMLKYIKLLNKQKSEDEVSCNKKEEYTGINFTIDKKIDPNLQNVKGIFGKSQDIVFREFKIGITNQIGAFVCFIDGLVDKQLLDEYVIKPLILNIHIIDYHEQLLSQNILTNVKDYILNSVEMRESSSSAEVIDGILSGDTALFIDNSNTVLIISTKGGKTRENKEPDTEVVIRGSREGFVEVLRDNTAMIRRKIKNSNLIFESLTLGKQTHTEINIAYINGIANPNIINEIKKRLNRIEIDSVLESGYIESFIEDSPFSLFSTIGYSEKPDKVAAKILEGRIAILVNGTPFVLTLPYLFIENFQVAEDYSYRHYFASFVRLLRLFAFFVTLTLPALYVAVESFHPEMIPTLLLITAAAAREGIPFPTFIEILIITIMFELLRESGVRMPRQLGQAVSIVGALVMGEVAVRAGIISTPAVIIGALTGIANFVIPSLLESVIFFRVFLIFLSAAFGLFGVGIGLMFMIGHLCSLRSFGAPYMAPFGPTIWQGIKDSFIRMPLWMLKSRPKVILWKNSKRQGFSTKSNKPSKNGGENK